MLNNYSFKTMRATSIVYSIISNRTNIIKGRIKHVCSIFKFLNNYSYNKINKIMDENSRSGEFPSGMDLISLKPMYNFSRKKGSE